MDTATLASITNTAQAVADMHINTTLTLVIVALIGVINALAFILKKK